MDRITNAHLIAKIETINNMLGVKDVDYRTVGAVRLEGAYGGTGVSRVVNEAGGVSTLHHYGTKREANIFLSGMIASLRILDNPSRI